MKKIFLLTTMLLTFAAADAQIAKYIPRWLDGWIYPAPKIFSYGGNLSFIFENNEDVLREKEMNYDERENFEKTMEVFNSDFELIKTFKIKGSPKYILFYDFDDNSYGGNRAFYFTQTLFNNDEKFEYCIKGDDNKLKIVNEEREVIFTFEQAIDKFSVLKIEDRIYLQAFEYDDVDVCYYYKLNPQTNSIEAVERAPIPSGRIYSVSGQQLSNPQKGLNIIDGKKVIK